MTPTRCTQGGIGPIFRPITPRRSATNRGVRRAAAAGFEPTSSSARVTPPGDTFPHEQHFGTARCRRPLRRSRRTRRPRPRRPRAPRRHQSDLPHPRRIHGRTARSGRGPSFARETAVTVIVAAPSCSSHRAASPPPEPRRRSIRPASGRSSRIARTRSHPVRTRCPRSPTRRRRTPRRRRARSPGARSRSARSPGAEAARAPRAAAAPSPSPPVPGGGGIGEPPDGTGGSGIDDAALERAPPRPPRRARRTP